MSVKTAMKSFFDRMNTRSKIVPGRDIGENPLLVETDGDSGWSFWREVEIQEPIDFTPLEKEFDLTLHSDIKELYGSYYHHGICGSFGEMDYTLFGCVPDEEPMETLRKEISQYRSYSTLRHMIPIGTDENGFLICMDNETGAVLWEDLDLIDAEPQPFHNERLWTNPKLYTELTPNIKEFIDNLYEYTSNKPYAGEMKTGVVSIWACDAESEEALFASLDGFYTDYDDYVLSEFEREFFCHNHDSNFREASYSERMTTLRQAIAGHSYSEEILHRIDDENEKTAGKMNGVILLYDYCYAANEDQAFYAKTTGEATGCRYRFIGVFEYEQ